MNGVRNTQLFDAVGEKVWFYSPRKYRYLSPKWTLQTTGPYDIIRKVNDVNYVIREPGKRRSFNVHVDRLRSYRLPVSYVTGGKAQNTFHRRSLARVECILRYQVCDRIEPDVFHGDMKL